MNQIAGFQINEQIYKGNNSLLFRGTRNMDKIPVVMKMLNLEYPSPEQLSRFKREYEITRALGGENIIQVYDLQEVDRGLMIVLEDFGGESVDKILGDLRLKVKEALALGIGMASALSQVHAHNVIHKDVNPSNFVWNREKALVKLIDFGISTELTREKPLFLSEEIPEGTLPYISPEQTGRMNRAVDYRSDLYSLGATLYEIFTGKEPFGGSNALELVYSHMAEKPVPPREIYPDIPVEISDIILKLLSKSAEERYQSALGLKLDLEYCLKELTSKGVISGLQMGKNDFPGGFEIPQKLYGRDKELEELKKMFKSNTRLLLVAGYSGIGKSSLVFEIQKNIVTRTGRFLTCKLNNLEKKTPYYAFIHTLGELIRHLLSESGERLEMWKEKLLEALKPNAGVLVELIPGLEQIIGPQTPPIGLNPPETQNRLRSVFHDFIRVFARKEHPLIIIFDDLQWSDLSTMELLISLVKADDMAHLLFIGTYRDNEIIPGHPLGHLLEEMKEKKLARVSRKIVLEPLSPPELNQWIADTLRLPPEETGALSELVFSKTKGNPFFTSQLLYSLYNWGAFRFLSAKGCWEWTMKDLEGVEISDNVVDLLTGRIQRLPGQTVTVLQRAACLGNQFEADKLILLADLPYSLITEALWTAIEEEIIIPLNSDYRLIRLADLQHLEVRFRFSHDRIHQAVYAMIPEEEKKALHLKIGRLYLASLQEKELSDVLFEVVNHLNRAGSAVTDSRELEKLGELNFAAGKRAKDSGAFIVAAGYFETAFSLFSSRKNENSLSTYCRYAFARAESAFLAGRGEDALKFCREMLTRCPGPDMGKIYILMARILDLQGKSREAVLEVLREGLLYFGIELPLDHGEIDQKVNQGIARMLAHLKAVSIEELVNLPEVTDEKKRMTMNLLLEVVPSAIQTYFPLFMLIQLTLFDLSLTYGTTEVSSKTFVDCGIILGPILGDYSSAYRLGEAAFALANKYHAEALKPLVYFVFSVFISPWKVHYQESLAYFDLARKRALENGDLLYASFALVHKLIRLLYVGTNLNVCREHCRQEIKLFSDWKAVIPLAMVEVILPFIEKFSNPPPPDWQTSWERQDQILEERVNEADNLYMYCLLGELEVLTLCLEGNLEAAEKWFDYLEPYNEGATGHYFIPDHHFFFSLVLIAKGKKAEAGERKKIRDLLNDHLEKLKNWGEQCPENFAHKYYLIAAAVADWDGESLETIVNFYKKAGDSLKTEGLFHMKALFNELYGQFWLERGEKIIGKGFIREAFYLYEQWGGLLKLDILKKKYPEFFRYPSPAPGGIPPEERWRTQTLSLDMESIVKASQAISREIEIEKLLKVLMGTIIENAGASRGFFLLKKKEDDKFSVEVFKEENSEDIIVSSFPLENNQVLCQEIIQYTTRVKKSIVLDNACSEGDFQSLPYVREKGIKSVLCTPVIYQNSIKGIVYLENNLMESVFSPERIEFIHMLSSQAAISIENARLYEDLEEKVRERTKELVKTRSQVVKAAHLAGMSEIASGVLHNIGNILNPILTSTESIMNSIARGQLYDLFDGFEKANAKFSEILESLSLSSTSMAGTLAQYYKVLHKNMSATVDQINQDANYIMSKTKLIHETVKNQEKHVGGQMFLSRLDLPEFLDHFTAIAMQDIFKGKVEIIRVYPRSRKIGILCQETKLYTIFVNLFTNAYEAMAAADPGDMRLTLALSGSGESVILEITDNGEGISKELLEKIFQYGFSTRPGARGFGLHVSANFMTEMKGRLSVTSEGKGKGATAVLVFCKG